MEEVIDLLEGSMNSIDIQQRKDSESRLTELTKEDPAIFLFHIVKCLTNETIKSNTRKLSGILFQNTLKNTAKVKECDLLWYNMSKDERDQIMNSLLESLASENKDVVKNAGSALSSILLLEISHGKSIKFIDVLCSNSNHENDNIRQASLLTLNYVCEKLSKDHIKIEEAEKIIAAYLQTLKLYPENSEDMNLAILGVKHSIKFISSFFGDGKDTFVMNEIFTALKHKDSKVRIIAMQCIVEIARLYYDKIEPFIEDIATATFESIQKDEIELRLYAIEVWASIAEQELSRIQSKKTTRNFINSEFDRLLMFLKLSFQEFNFENEDDSDYEEEHSVYLVGACLNIISQVVGDKILNPIIEYVDSLLEQEDCDKILAITALGAIIEGPSTENLIDSLQPKIPMIAILMNHENKQVRHSALWLLCKIAKYLPELLIQNKIFKDILYPKFMQGLDAEPNVASKVACILADLAESVLKTERKLDSCIFSEFFEEIIEKLFKLAQDEEIDESEMSKLRTYIFSALNNLLSNAPLDCEKYCVTFTEKFIKILEDSLKSGLDQSLIELQGFTMCSLSCIFASLQHKILENTGETILKLVFNIFKQRCDVCDEGFLVLSSLCTKFPNLMNEQVDYYSSYVFYGLRSKTSSILMNACGLLSDLCTLVESDWICKNFTQYMPILLEHLKDPILDRVAKTSILRVFEDTFLITKEKFEDYFEEVLIILENAMKSSKADFMELLENKSQDCSSKSSSAIGSIDPEDLQYLILLQSSLIECLTCFVQNISNANDSMFKSLTQQISNILDFALFCLCIELQPSLKTIKETVGLIYDVLEKFYNFDSSLKNFAQNERLLSIVKFLISSEDDESKQIGNLINDQIERFVL